MPPAHRRARPHPHHSQGRRLVLLHRLVTLGAIAAVAALRAAPARAQDASSRATASGGAGSQLQPGDAIKLRVWPESTFSGQFTVDERGQAVLPRIGQMRVTGLSADSLKRSIIGALSTYLRDPSIEVTLLRRVSVGGEVRTPNVYMVDPTMTVADVLALAGGPNPDGRRDRVEVHRHGQVVNRNVPRGALIGDAAVQSGDQLIVPQRSWASRNVGLVAGLASSLVFLAVSILNN